MDINKGDDQNLDYRSRMVAQEINIDKRENLLAATPPLEAKKMLFSLVASTVGTPREKKLDFIDLRRASFPSDARRTLYLKLPPEDEEE